jgi:hypothetical protein
MGLLVYFLKRIPSTLGLFCLIISVLLYFPFYIDAKRNDSKDTVKPTSNSQQYNITSLNGFSSKLSDGAFEFSQNDIVNTPIILPANATHYTKEAANILATYINKVVGATPQIVTGFPNPMPQKAIWVGFQPGIERFFPGVDLAFKYPEEVINTANPNHILISGRDAYDPKKSSLPDAFGNIKVSNLQQEYGTCNAVFTFIQDQLNVRWLWPGELGEDIIALKSLEIKPFYYRHHPTILDRSGILYRISLYVQKQYKDEQDWGKYQRMQLSSMYIKGDHAFFDWWEKYGEKHPGYFALNRKGERKPLNNPRFVKLCLSNPDVWDRWLLDVEEQLKENPYKTLFSAGANDGWGQGHCTCQKCRAWDHKGFDPKKPEMADRDLRFVNTLAKKLKEKYPDKPYKVMALAYGFTRPAPKEVKPDENVIIINASNFLQQGDEARKQNMGQFDDWAMVSGAMAWRPNLGTSVGGIIGMPNVSPHQAAKDIKFVAERGTIGLYFDTYWHHWATQGIQYYCLAQLAWNPYINIDSLLGDYHKRAYGEAAKEMQQYWELMETTRNKVINSVNNQYRVLSLPDFYTEDWFKTAQSLINSAKSKVIGKHLQRVEFTEIGLQYTKLIVDCRVLNRQWENDKTNKGIMEMIDKKFAEAEKMRKSLSPNKSLRYAINFDRSFKWTKAKFMMGLHYQSPVKPGILNEVNDME